MTKFSVLTIAEARTVFEIDDASLFEPFGLDEAGTIFSLVDGRPLTHELPELPCLALVARSESQVVRLEALQDRFREARMAFIPDVVLVDQPLSFETLMLGAAFGMETYLVQQAGLISQLSRDLFEMRKQHETLQDSLSRLEDYFYSRRVSLVEEFFASQPKGVVDISPKGTGSRGWLEQLLPATSKTLSAFALHIGRADPKSKGGIKVALHVPETRRDLWTWRLDLKDLRAGWLQFGLPETLGGIAKSAVLHIKITGEAGLFRLSVGGIHPLELYQLSTDKRKPIVDRALAMRLFISPPGIAIRHDEATCLPIERDGTLPEFARPLLPTTIRVARELVARIRRLTDDGWAEPSFEPVSGDTYKGSVLVHPVNEAPTLALLPDCIPVGATAVEADVFVDNPQAGVVAFRLVVLRGSTVEGPLTALLGNTPAENSLMSEWILLGPGRCQSISIPITPAASGPCSLVMITRMANAETPDFAWAKFADIRFLIP